MARTKQHAQGLQDQLEKGARKEFNWDEAMEMAENMNRISELMIPFQQEEERKQRKLKEFPKGFHLDGKGYTCAICRGSCSQEETWYDQHGLKCMECQKAVDRGDIPSSIASDDDSWYDRWSMERIFNVNRHALRRWIKAGILKARTMERDGHENVTLILLEDNKDFLPPKNSRLNMSCSASTSSSKFVPVISSHEHGMRNTEFGQNTFRIPNSDDSS